MQDLLGHHQMYPAAEYSGHLLHLTISGRFQDKRYTRFRCVVFIETETRFHLHTFRKLHGRDLDQGTKVDIGKKMLFRKKYHIIFIFEFDVYMGFFYFVYRSSIPNTSL